MYKYVVLKSFEILSLLVVPSLYPLYYTPIREGIGSILLNSARMYVCVKKDQVKDKLNKIKTINKTILPVVKFDIRQLLR